MIVSVPPWSGGERITPDGFIPPQILIVRETGCPTAATHTIIRLRINNRFFSFLSPFFIEIINPDEILPQPPGPLNLYANCVPPA